MCIRDRYAPAPDLNQAYAWLKESAETANAKKSEMAYATAAALWQAKKLSQARTYAVSTSSIIISFTLSFTEITLSRLFWYISVSVFEVQLKHSTINNLSLIHI